MAEKFGRAKSSNQVICSKLNSFSMPTRKMFGIVNFIYGGTLALGEKEDANVSLIKILDLRNGGVHVVQPTPVCKELRAITHCPNSNPKNVCSYEFL